MNRCETTPSLQRTRLPRSLRIRVVQAVCNANVAERDLALAVVEEADSGRVGIPRTNIGLAFVLNRKEKAKQHTEHR